MVAFSHGDGDGLYRAVDLALYEAKGLGRNTLTRKLGATLIVAKQRHGSTGNVPLHFQSDITKFTSPNFKDYSDWGQE